MFVRVATLIAALYVATPGNLAAQPPFSQREDAQALIFVIQELLLNRVQDLDFGAILAGEPRAEVNPRTSADAGKFVLQFDDTQEWTVRYEASDRLLPEDGESGAGGLPFTPAIYGHPSDIPGASVPIEPETQTYRTQNNVFHFWVGGEIETANAAPGVYTGVFTLTIEPL